MEVSKKSTVKNPLEDNRFQVRESPLKNAFDNSSAVRGTFSAIVTMFGLVFVVMTAVYYSKPDVFHGDLAFVQRSFANFSCFIVQWIILHAALFLIAFPATKHHVMNRDSNYFNYQIYILSTVAIVSVVPVYTIFTFKLHPVLSLAIVMEQIRILMKLIAYLVENGKKKRYFEETDDVAIKAPALSSFLYFMFAPTLIYRDHYPSSLKPTNWKLVASYAAQVLACIFMGMILIRHQLQPRFNIIGMRPLTIDDITGIFLWSITFAWFIGLAIGYAFLHAWMNMFAEMLNFGDRLFYKDWFSATDAMDFMRTWNYLIHSWIVEYLYKPVLRSTGSKPFAIFVVMAMAGLVHDYVINMSQKYFLLYETTFIPIMLFTTCWTQWMQNPEAEEKKVAKVEKKEPMGTNIKMFIAIAITNMLECMVITAEVYAVRNCDRPENSWKGSILAPRFLSCPSFDFH